MQRTNVKELAKKSNVLLLDIEGTTSSIRFVKDVLFPYASLNVENFLKTSWDDPAVVESVDDLRNEAEEDLKNKIEGAVFIPPSGNVQDIQIEALVKSVKWQISLDRKTGPLKKLQALIWKKGFESGDIKGHVYEDVPVALKLWKNNSMNNEIFIYSSGAVLAQKLLFANSVDGDMLNLINGHFDTGVGGKQEAQSYKNIVEKIDRRSEDILFLTDIVKEGEAAREAGIKVVLVFRDGNAPFTDDDKGQFPIINSFLELV